MHNSGEHNNFLKDVLDMKGGKALIAAIAVLIYLICAYVVGTFATLSTAFMSVEKKPGMFEKIVVGFTDGHYLITTIIFVVFVGAIVFFSFVGKNNNRTMFEDERQVQYDTKGVYGTARPMRKKEAKEVFEVGSIEEVKGPILGQFSSEGKETICLSPKTDRNRNILILGSPGTGKSFCYVRGAVYQAVRRGESVLVTDPKGEIYADMAGFLREQGYEVRVFDLVDMQASDAWDCMQEIFDPETGDLNQLRLNEFSQTIFTNTSQGKDDPFWGVGEKNLFNAAIAYTAFMYEKDMKRMYLRSVKMIFADKDEKGEVINLEYQKELMSQLAIESDTTMNDRRKIVRFVLETYYGADSVETEMQRIESGEWTHENGIHTCDIASVYFMLVGKTLDDIEALFNNERIPLHHVASIAWSIFKNGSDNVKPGFVTGLTQRLYLFQMRDLRRITSHQDTDTIVLERMGERKCAYFCVISDKSDAMRPISSLFFNFFFRDVSDAADRYGPENRIPVNVICDEFANLGAIPGFEVVISTVRSRKINISIILQAITQLAQVYDINKSSTIIGCCDTLLFLGCNDPDTAEFMSNLSGTASIRADTIKENIGPLGNKPFAQGMAYSEGGGKRVVYNPDEIRRLPRDEVLIYHQGCNMLKAKRCGYIEHPFFKEGMPEKELLSQRTPASVRFKNNESADAFFANDINNARRAQEAAEAQKYEEEKRKNDNDDNSDSKRTPTDLTSENASHGRGGNTSRKRDNKPQRNRRSTINPGGTEIRASSRSASNSLISDD